VFRGGDPVAHSETLNILTIGGGAKAPLLTLYIVRYYRLVKWRFTKLHWDSNMLTLSEAIKTRKIQEFIAQEEARGVEPVNASDLEKAIKLLATQQPQEDQTSH
jgi:hypothetical protein